MRSCLQVLPSSPHRQRSCSISRRAVRDRSSIRRRRGPSRTQESRRSNVTIWDLKTYENLECISQMPEETRLASVSIAGRRHELHAEERETTGELAPHFAGE